MNEQKWLIKSSGRLLGPLSISEVVAHLKQQTITVIDEIRSPSDRWIFIREHSDVMAIVRELGETFQFSESSTEATAFQTKTRTKTEAIDEESITATGDAPEEIPDHLMQKVIQAQEKTISRKTDFDGKKAFGSISDVRFQQHVEGKRKGQRLLLLFSFLIFMGSLGGYFVYDSNQQKLRLTQNMRQLDNARLLLQQGKHSNALAQMEGVYLSHPELFSNVDKLAYSLLLIKADPRTQRAEAVISNIPRPEGINEWRTWMMAKLNMAVARGAWDEARLIGSELLQSVPGDFEVELGRAQVEYLAGRYAEAIQILRPIVGMMRESRRHYDQGVLLVGLAALNLRTEPAKTEGSAFAVSLLENGSLDFDPHHLFKKILLSSLLLNSDEGRAKEVAESIWDKNIFESDQYVLPLSMVTYATSPEAMHYVCLDLTGALASRFESGGLEGEGGSAEKRDRIPAMTAVCRYIGGGKNEALRDLATARKMNPSSPLLAAVEANLLLNSERIPEARGRLPICEGLPLCQLAKLRECYLREDDECIRQGLEATQASWVGPFYNVVSAQVAKKRGNDFSFKDQVLRGLQAFPDYQPLMGMRP